MDVKKFVSLVLLSVVLMIGCSRAPERSTATSQEVECQATATANGGYRAACSHNLVYNGQPKGLVSYEHEVDPSRGCSVQDSRAHVQGNETADPGEVHATLDDVSEKISYEVDDANITILLSDQEDRLWVRTSVPGTATETEQKVYCPGLEQEARTRAHQGGLTSSKDCPADDPHQINLGTFSCPALEAEIKSRPAHKRMVEPSRIHKMAAGMVLLSQAKDLATNGNHTASRPRATDSEMGQSERLAMNCSPTRAAALPALGVIFSALGTIFSSEKFQGAFSSPTNTDSVKGPVVVQ